MPEVETVRRQLEPELVGKRITSASVLDERLTRPEPPQSLDEHEARPVLIRADPLESAVSGVIEAKAASRECCLRCQSRPGKTRS